jgi:four helix bundle protein
MAFDAYDVSISLIRSIAPLLVRLTAVDPKLADQARRAVTSVALNIQEANRRTGRDRRNRFRISLGSAAELGAAMDVAVAFGYLADAEVAAPRELLDRVRAMTYRLAR